MSSIRVLVASHIRLYREWLEKVLRALPDFTLVGNASSAVEAIEQTRMLSADVVLLDLAMGGAFSAAKELACGGGASKVVALGMTEDESQMLRCAKSGIAGYVMRDGSVEDVVAAVKSAARREVHCSAKVAGSPFGHLAAMTAESPRRSGNDALTPREAQILEFVQEGMSNRMISRILEIELSTVKNHVHKILVKLGIRRRTEAISLLYRSGSGERAAAVECNARAFPTAN